MQFSNETTSLVSFLLVVASVTAACEVDSSSEDAPSDDGTSNGGSAEAGSTAEPSGGNSQGGAGNGAGGTHNATGGGLSAGAGGIAATGGVAGSGTGAHAGAAGRGGQPGDGGEAGHGVGGEGGPGGEGGLGGEGGEGAGQAEFLYVSRLVGGVLSFRVDPESGAPLELDSSPTDSRRFVYSLAVDPEQRFVLALEPDPGHVETYVVGDDGSLPKIPNSSLVIDAQPITMAFAPSGERVYVGTLEDQSIRAFTVEPTTGALTAASEPLVLGTPPAFLAVDPTGRFLYESQEFMGGVRAFRIDANGGLTELDASPFGETLVRAGALVFAPDGAFLFSSGQGLSAFAIDPTSGDLEPVDGSPFTTDIGSDFFAGNLAIDPQGEFLYATAFTATRHVAGFSIDRVTGVLEPVPRSPLTTSSPYSVGVDPSGRFVYVGNDTGDTSVFAIDRRNGALDELEGSPFLPGGPQPGFGFVSR